MYGNSKWYIFLKGVVETTIQHLKKNFPSFNKHKNAYLIKTDSTSLSTSALQNSQS